MNLINTALPYLAPILTLILAILGIFFSKPESSGSLSTLGYTILLFTLCSGSYSIYETHQRLEADRTSQERLERIESDARKSSNVLVATVAGLDTVLRSVILWMEVDEVI